MCNETKTKFFLGLIYIIFYSSSLFYYYFLKLNFSSLSSKKKKNSVEFFCLHQEDEKLFVIVPKLNFIIINYYYSVFQCSPSFLFLLLLEKKISKHKNEIEQLYIFYIIISLLFVSEYIILILIYIKQIL